MLITMNKLKKEAKRITQQIVQQHNPQRVILFGSLTNGNSNPKDIDLLVIKNTSERKIERAQNLYRTLNWSQPLDIIVRTPEELKEGLEQKNPFFLNALQGETLYDGRK